MDHGDRRAHERAPRGPHVRRLAITAASGSTSASACASVGFRVPALYVSVDDLEGCAAALAASGIQGVDARKRVVP